MIARARNSPLPYRPGLKVRWRLDHVGNRSIPCRELQRRVTRPKTVSGGAAIRALEVSVNPTTLPFISRWARRVRLKPGHARTCAPILHFGLCRATGDMRRRRNAGGLGRRMDPREICLDGPTVPPCEPRNRIAKSLSVQHRTKIRSPTPCHSQCSAHRALAARPWSVCRISGPEPEHTEKEGVAYG